MDDHEYARQLFEILTRPDDPARLPGHLDADWIDREDGFGTVLQVRSITVVPGQYGSQIEVAFVLDLPDDVSGPAEGSLLLPLDAEWREVSGLAEPEDYAPRVASRLMHHGYRQVQGHTGTPRRAYDLPGRDAQRAMLLHVLAREGHVTEPAPDRYVVQGRNGDELVVILTADQWERLLQRHGPPRDGAFDYYEELLAARSRATRFIVFWEDDVALSTREELPPASAPQLPLREIRRRIAEARETGRDYGWFAYSPDDTEDQLPG